MLEYEDLLNMAQTNLYFEELARDIFRRKKSPKTIEIAPFVSYIPFREMRFSIPLQNYELVQKSLKSFGHEIRKIDLRSNLITPIQRHQIHRLMEQYCSQSLTSLFLNVCDERTFDYFQFPLEKVENLTIGGELKSAKNGLKLNQIFPGLRQLSIFGIITNIQDSDLLNITFPHLISFMVSLSFSSSFYLHIADFIKLNSQIQDLTIEFCDSFDYIKLASEHLPNLDRLDFSLQILQEIYTGPKIYFDSVKTVKMIWGEFDFTDAIGFNQLESLEIKCVNCVNFVTQFSNLTHLHLDQDGLGNNDILHIRKNLTNLKELIIWSLSNFDERTIIKLVNGNEKLEKLKMILRNTDYFEALNNQFSRDWTVTKSGHEIFMNKKLHQY